MGPPVRARLVGGALALLGAWGLPGPALASPAGGSVRGAASLVVVAPRPTGRVRGSSPVAGSRRVSLVVALRPGHPATLERLLAGLYDAGSPAYHRFLGRGVFARRFAPDPTAVARLQAYFARHGLRVRRQAFALSLEGRASSVEAAFHVRLLAGGQGSPGQVPGGPLLLPGRLAGAVTGVVGASSLPGGLPHLVRFAPSRPAPPPAPADPGPTGRSPGAGRTTVEGPAALPRLATTDLAPATCPAAASVASASGGISLVQLGARYGISSLLAAGDDGQGSTVAVYELAAPSPSDVSAFLSCEGLSTSVTPVMVDGGGSSASGQGTIEADLDLEQVATQAPGASILAYEGPNTPSGQYDVWSQIVSDDRASVVSTSWGLCEAASSGSIAAETTLFEQAAAQGQTIVAAAGDSGSEDCWSQGQDGLAVDFPASDPYVTGVGGTVLTPAGEAVWNQCEGATTSACAEGGGHAGGGGASAVFAQPSWQAPLDTLATASAGCGASSCRGVPDLSANAGTPEVVYAGGAWTAVGGTSAASPLVAGMAADLESGCDGRLGALDPGLYAAAPSAYGTGLQDVTLGSNDLTGAGSGQYAAGPGYDLASGLGVPLATGLACPEVTSVSPATAAAGSQVLVTGSDLAHASVSFGGAPARVVAATATSATVVVPAGTGSLEVRAASPIGAGSLAAPFTDVAAPSPAAPSPAGGSGGRAGLATGPASSAGGDGLTVGATVLAPPAPARLRAAGRGGRLVLDWARPPAGAGVQGYVLAVRSCPQGRACHLRHLLLGPSRTSVALRLPRGTYLVALSAVGPGGRRSTLRRRVNVRPTPTHSRPSGSHEGTPPSGAPRAKGAGPGKAGG